MGTGPWSGPVGLTQGLLAAMVTDTAPQQLRGSAYGVYNLVSGIAMLIASVIAGVIWDRFGASTTFFTGAAFTGLALLGLLLFRKTTKMTKGRINNLTTRTLIKETTM